VLGQYKLSIIFRFLTVTKKSEINPLHKIKGIFLEINNYDFPNKQKIEKCGTHYAYSTPFYMFSIANINIVLTDYI
jgi:hypothetical protein